MSAICNMNYAKPTVEKNSKSVILHVGTNDLKHSTPKEIAVSISSLGKRIEEYSPETKVVISEIISRFDDSSLMPKIVNLNARLKQVCDNYSWGFITHKNIKANYLNPYGLHLNKQGFTKLAGNFIEYLKHCN